MHNVYNSITMRRGKAYFNCSLFYFISFSFLFFFFFFSFLFFSFFSFLFFWGGGGGGGGKGGGAWDAFSKFYQFHTNDSIPDFIYFFFISWATLTRKCSKDINFKGK